MLVARFAEPARTKAQSAAGQGDRSHSFVRYTPDLRQRRPAQTETVAEEDRDQDQGHHHRDGMGQDRPPTDRDRACILHACLLPKTRRTGLRPSRSTASMRLPAPFASTEVIPSLLYGDRQVPRTSHPSFSRTSVRQRLNAGIRRPTAVNIFRERHFTMAWRKRNEFRWADAGVIRDWRRPHRPVSLRGERLRGVLLREDDRGRGSGSRETRPRATVSTSRNTRTSVAVG